MKYICASILATFAGISAHAEGCPDQVFTYSGAWLEEGQPVANYRLTLPSLLEGDVGCYWIAATPSWGITEDVTMKARLDNPNLENGLLIAVDQSWIWVSFDGMTATSFKEMWFNRQTRGVPR